MARSYSKFLVVYDDGTTEKVTAQTVSDALDKLEQNSDYVYSIINFGTSWSSENWND